MKERKVWDLFSIFVETKNSNMEYITDEQGQVKVMSDKGDIKWLPKKLAEDAQLMRRNKFSIVPKPITTEPIDNPTKDNTSVAEFAPAKRGRPFKNQ